jgi:cytochrome c oxidase subunit 2
MLDRTPRRLAFLAAAGLAAALGLAARHAGGAEPGPVIEITAHRFEFSPAELSVARDQTTTLRLTSTDVTHGFFQRDLGIDATIERGHPTDVQIHPTAPGRYVVICDHFCGSGHGNMKMVITVQ